MARARAIERRWSVPGPETVAGRLPASASARRASQMAMMPAIPEQAAPNRSAPDSPSSSTSTRPATSVPTTAPIVLAA